MLNRLKWIAVSYLTSPVVWTLAAASAFFWLITAMFPTFEHQLPAEPTMMQQSASIRTREMLESVRRERSQQKVVAIDLDALWRDMESKENVGDGARVKEAAAINPPDRDFFHILREFPLLHSVRIKFYGNDIGTRDVAGVKFLNELEIDGILSPPDISWARELRFLGRLEINCPADRLTGLDALADLPFLQTISLNAGCSDATLRQLAGLPHLLTLTIRRSTSDDHPLTKAGFEALARAPSLKIVNLIGWHAGESPDVPAIARAALPPLPKCLVSPLAPPDLWFMRALGVWMGLGILAFALGLQLSAQFRSPASRLAPHFVLDHALVAVGLAAALVGFSAWRLTLAGFPASCASGLAVFGLLLLAPSAAAWPLVMARQNQGSGGLSRFLITLPGIAFVLMQFVAHWIHSNETCMARPWAVTVVLLAASLPFVAMAVWVLRSLSDASTPLATAGRGLSIWPDLSARNNVWPMNSGRRDHQFERWLGNHAERTWWQRIERWRLGNMPTNWLRMWLLQTVGTVALLMVAQRFMPKLMDSHLLVRMGAGSGMASALAVAGSALVSSWRTRMHQLPMEATRPGWDRTFRRELAAALAIDLAPLALITAAAGSLVINLQAGMTIDWTGVPLSFLTVALLGYSLLLSCGTVVVVVRRTWLAMAIIIGSLVVDHLLFMTGMFAGGVVNAQRLQLLLWIPITIAISIIILAQRRWWTMELADLG